MILYIIIIYEGHPFLPNGPIGVGSYPFDVGSSMMQYCINKENLQIRWKSSRTGDMPIKGRNTLGHVRERKWKITKKKPPLKYNLKTFEQIIEQFFRTNPLHRVVGKNEMPHVFYKRTMGVLFSIWWPFNEFLWMNFYMFPGVFKTPYWLFQNLTIKKTISSILGIFLFVMWWALSI